jgi:hypothetical protein
LRIVDIDVDYPRPAASIREIALHTLGPAPAERFRKGNPRRALLYRAAEGEPRKQFVKGPWGKVEVLGHGNQLHAFGLHPSGATLEWTEAPGAVKVADLTAVTEEQIKAFLVEAAPLIGGTAKDVRAETRVGESTIPLTRRLPPSIEEVVELLNRLPNPSDTDYWRYQAVMLGARGCIVALEAAGKEPGAAEIGTAAANWAERWECPSDVDEHEEWDRQWSRSNVVSAGWQTLERIAYELIPTYGLEQAQKEFGVLPPEPKTKRGRWEFMNLKDLAEMPDPEWLIDGLIPENSLAMVYGPPKSGKTFIVLSMALHVAAGKPWFGREVKQGAVVHIVGEGAGGFKLRTAAAQRHHGISDDVPFWVLPHAVKFNDPHEVEKLEQGIKNLVGNQPVRWVIIDTLARAMPGSDENSAGEVGKVIALCDQLKERLGCAATPVHHTGKDVEKGSRGSSVIDGAVDAQLTTSRRKDDGSDIVTLTTKYQKEGEEAAPMFFDLVAVQATEKRTSLVPVLRDSEPPPSQAKIPPSQQAALEVLRDLLAARGVDEILDADWRTACVNGRLVSTSDNEKTHKEAFRTAFLGLQEKRLVAFMDGNIRLK